MLQILAHSYIFKSADSITSNEIISGLLLIGAILLHSKSEGMGAIGGQARSFKPPTDDMESGLKKITFILIVLFLARQSWFIF